MSHIVSLREAIAENVHDGDILALEGFTHLIPFAAGHEVIRQRRRNLSLVRMTPDLIYDQMIGMGCAARLTFSWGGNPGAGSLFRFRDAIENDWPQPLQIEERTHADIASAYVAGAANLPFSVMRGYAGTDLPNHRRASRRNAVDPTGCDGHSCAEGRSPGQCPTMGDSRRAEGGCARGEARGRDS